MSKILSASTAQIRIIAPTTTRMLAQRMLSASHEIARAMPRGFYAPTALDILLALHVAEDDARYLAPAELEVPGAPSARSIERWLTVLAAEGLIELRNGLLALSENGYALVTTVLEAVHESQRALD